MQITNHYLQGDHIQTAQKTPNTSGPFKDGLPDTIIIHYTAGSSAASSVRTLTDPTVKASAHLVIGRDNAIYQLAPFNIVTWHAGQSEYNGRVGYNQYAIGIEIDNAGILTKSGNEFRSWFGRIYPPEEVIEAIHRNETQPRFWHAYTEQQLEIVENICRALINTYNIKMILGHEEVSPNRKTDPGPAFPLDKFRDLLLHMNRDENEPETLAESGRVTVDKLNIRSGPDGTQEKIAKPLAKGTKVTIHDEMNGWLKITTQIEGWVYGQYIEQE